LPWPTSASRRIRRTDLQRAAEEYAGEPEKALDQLEPLLKMPYYLCKNPEFQKLVAGGK
jgi:hypothetical protein